MRVPRAVARFNRRVTNPLAVRFGGWAPLNGRLEHVGRKSGKPYRTPLTVFNAEVDGKPGVAILLTYGPDRDWLKNLNAAGSARMQRHGKTFGVAHPQTVSKEQAATHVGGGAHRVFARFPFEQAVLLTKTG